jgi:hypothetical protein
MTLAQGLRYAWAMRILLVPVVAAVLALAAGCDTTAPLDPNAQSQSQTNGSTTKKTSGAAGATGAGTTTGVAGATAVGQTGAGGSTSSSGASMCDQPTGDRLRPSSIADLQQIVRGTWTLCTMVGLFDQPQAGITIGPDDRYVFLDLVGGQLVPKSGLQNKGHVEYEDTSDLNGPSSFALSFVSDMNFTIVSAAIISDSPRQLLINNEGVEMYTYAAINPAPSTGTTSSGLPTGTLSQPTGASACAQPTGDRLTVSSVAEMQQTIRGTWQLCSMLGLDRQPQAGVFIGDDDRYVFLDLVNGQLVPKTGLQNKGHLEYLDTLQTNFVSDMGGFVTSFPIFSDVPRQLIIDNEGVDTYTYGRIP